MFLHSATHHQLRWSYVEKRKEEKKWVDAKCNESTKTPDYKMCENKEFMAAIKIATVWKMGLLFLEKILYPLISLFLHEVHLF